MIRDILEQADRIQREIGDLRTAGVTEDDFRTQELLIQKARTLRPLSRLTPEDRVYLARSIDRPRIDDFISHLFTDFFEQKGDHLYGDDPAIYGGIARYHGMPVTVLGHRKGHNAAESVKYNFGMAKPEGYRKAKRLMEQAEKFHRPIITFIDTPGAYPGIDAEEHGQGEAIAKNLAYMSTLHVPVIAVVTGEGSSGGALGIGVANRILMLENAVYSVLSPEGFASILWKDPSRHGEACEMMKLTARDIYEAGVADEVVSEPLGGAQEDPGRLYANLDNALERNLAELSGLTPQELRADRKNKFRRVGDMEMNARR
ncbi:acetyl-CoA carboxylase carboxyl transferase subunit alpha [Lachnospiraceae bacterium NK3A20]|nr:acetyl-CoA carboxylase carboxyl transferase subunit alpha [Lachnospiraceae bacterium NK3A20]